MSDDRILEALGALEQESRREDERTARLRALAEGSATEEDREPLASDPDAALFAPLSKTFTASIAERALADLARENGARGGEADNPNFGEAREKLDVDDVGGALQEPTAGGTVNGDSLNNATLNLEADRASNEDLLQAAGAASFDAGAASTNDKLIRPRFRRAATIAAPLLAMAAALAFVVLRSPAIVELPRYELSVRGGERSVRGIEGPRAGEPLRLVRGSTIRLELRPDAPARIPLDAQAFIYAARTLEPWKTPLQISSEGAVLLDTTADDALARHAGPIELVIAVHAQGAAPSVARLQDALERGLDSGEGGGWRVYRQAIELGAAAPR